MTVYLNNAGTTWPKPPGVSAAAAQAWDDAPVASDEVLPRVQSALAGWIGADTPGRMLLTPGCTAALSLALDDLPWAPGDALLTSTLEHHALVRPVERLVRTRGVEHRVVPRGAEGPFDLEAARALLADGRVRLVAVTHGSNVTGELLPVAALSQLAHAAGARVLLDAAQTLGVLPVDVGTLGVDMLTFAGHKGPLAPQGIGGLWAAPELVFESPAALCELDESGAPMAACSPFPGYCDVGSVSLGALRGLDVALRWHAAEGVSAWARARELAAEARTVLSGRAGCELLGGGDAHTAALSLRLAGLPLAQAEAHFAARGVHLRAGQHCAPMALAALGANEGCVRISFGPFNGQADLTRLLDAMPA